MLESVGAAKIILDNEITGHKLNRQINEIISDKSNIETMEQNALKISPSFEQRYTTIKLNWFVLFDK